LITRVSKWLIFGFYSDADREPNEDDFKEQVESVRDVRYIPLLIGETGKQNSVGEKWLRLNELRKSLTITET